MAPRAGNRSENAANADVNTAKKVNYRGVREKSSDRYGAEITDPSTKKIRWLGSFGTTEEAARAYHNAARKLKGAKAVTNFPAPSLQLDTVHNQRCTTAAIPFPPPPFPWTHMNEGLGVQRASDHSMTPSRAGNIISIPNFIPSNLVDYAIILQQQQPKPKPQQMSLPGEIVGPPPHTMKIPNGYELEREGGVSNHGNKKQKLSVNIAKQLKPWSDVYMNDGLGLQPANRDHNMTPSPTGNLRPSNLVDYAILLQLQQPPQPMSLPGEIVGPQTMKIANGHELVQGGGIAKNMLSAASQTSETCVCDWSSSSTVVDTSTLRSFDLNLPAPAYEDERSPSLTLSLGLDFLKQSSVRPKAN